LKVLSRLSKGKTATENLCPLTGELIFDPVIAEDGHTYERLAIECWFVGHEVSPLEGTKLSTKTLFPNQVMKKLTKQIYEANKSQISK